LHSLPVSERVTTLSGEMRGGNTPQTQASVLVLALGVLQIFEEIAVRFK
jgi:hypothetical protein